MQDITLLQAFFSFLITLVGETLGIFGGGSFFIQPALLAIGMPPHLVVAHDASAAAGASVTSFHVFRKNGKIDFALLFGGCPAL